MTEPPATRFAVIGVNHDHIYSLVDVLLQAGAELASFFAPENDLANEFAQHYPDTTRAGRMADVLDDQTIQIVVSAGIPNERADIGVQAMRHGKDFFTDKPGFTTLDQLAAARQAHNETGRMFLVGYGRLTSKAMTRASELIKAGAIGRPLQTIGLGPHKINTPRRPDWFFERERYGGIITDLGTHLVDQFLHFTGSGATEVVSAQIANFNHPEFPELEDFGDAVLRSSTGVTGYLRVDWFTPSGLPTFGDQRLFIMGTDGYLEVRGQCDLAGRPGGQHLFLADQDGVRYIDASDAHVTFGQQLLDDVHNRTETAMSQEHCFRVSELCLQAEEVAQRIQV